MAEQCDFLREQTEDTCVSGPKGWTKHIRVTQTFWCRDLQTGWEGERSVPGEWIDTHQPCGPSLVKPPPPGN